MSLLSDLRATGERILESELPQVSELRQLVGALVLHLEQHLADLGRVEIEKLAGIQTPPDDAPPAEAEPPLPPAEVETKAEVPIVSEAAPAKSTDAPPADTADPGDDEGAEATEVANLKAELAQLQSQLAAATAQAPAVSSDTPSP